MATSYTVQPSDTLDAIAKKYGTTPKALATSNNITDPNIIHPGLSLNIPASLSAIPGYTDPRLVSSSIFSTSTTPLNTISAESLTPSTQPIVTPTAPTDNSAQNRYAATIAGISPTAPTEPTTYAPTDSPTAPTDRDKILSSIYDALNISSTQGDATVAAQKEYDVAGKREALNNIDAKILKSNAYYDKRAAEIDKNAEGDFGGAADQKKAALEKERLGVVGDLNIEKLIAQGDVDTALKLVDEKIAAKFDPIEKQIKLGQTYLTLANNNLSDKERLTMESDIKEKQSQLDSARDLEKQKELIKFKAAYDTSPASNKGGLTSGTLVYSAADRAQDVQTLEASRGTDNFVDPNIYLTLYKNWIQAGGTLEDFLRTYPPANYVNPDNTFLPYYLLPKGAGREV